LGVGILSLVVAGLLAGWYFKSGELGEKQPYSVLQGLEYARRQQADAVAVFLKDYEGTGYDVVGLPLSGGEYPRAWIILNAVPGRGGVFSVPPATNFKVECAFVDELKRKSTVHASVEQFLRGGCSR
jgi:hypothetical protein